VAQHGVLLQNLLGAGVVEVSLDIPPDEWCDPEFLVFDGDVLTLGVGCVQ
jgi:hypothetical protein